MKNLSRRYVNNSFGGSSLLFLLLLMLSGSLFPQNKWHIEKDSMNFAILVSDYQSYNFERGSLSKYIPMDSVVNCLPVKSTIEPQVDFGGIIFVYLKNNDTLFSAGIVWQGQGKIRLPENFLPADSFSISTMNANPPLSVEYFYNTIPQLDTSTYNMKADSAWDAVKSLDIVKAFADYPYRAGIYLYTPCKGVPTQNGFSNTVGAKWIVFLYYDKSTISSVEQPERMPAQFKLMQNYPNPFNPATIIEYQLPKNEIVTLKVYDMLGREVKTLLDGESQTSGTYKIIFNGDKLSSGIYFYKLTAKGNYLSLYRKMILLK